MYTCFPPTSVTPIPNIFGILFLEPHSNTSSSLLGCVDAAVRRAHSSRSCCGPPAIVSVCPAHTRASHFTQQNMFLSPARSCAVKKSVQSPLYKLARGSAYTNQYPHSCPSAATARLSWPNRGYTRVEIWTCASAVAAARRLRHPSIGTGHLKKRRAAHKLETWIKTQACCE